MSNSINSNQHDEEVFLERAEIKDLEGMVLTLSGNVIALRIELVTEQRKLMSYFKMLSKQMYEIKNDLDYIRAYLDIELEDSKSTDNEKWEQV